MSSSFPLHGMRVRIAGETDTGRSRSHNEDYLYLPRTERLVLVADGMGGHASGDVASRLAVETVTRFFDATVDEPDETWPFRFDHHFKRNLNRLEVGIKLANFEIFSASQRDNRYKGMGTTLVGGLFCDDILLLAHVGDSRIYRFRSGDIEQITEDHSLLNDYIKMKRLSPEEAERFPHKNVLVRALGMKEAVEVDLRCESLRIGDIYLFCTDGLSGMVADDSLADVLAKNRDLDSCCEELVAMANQNGGTDNITVALARIEPG